MANRSDGASAISRTIRVLEAFSYEAPFLPLTAIAQRTGIPLSSVHRIVNELMEHQLLERMPDRSYRVGNRLWELGTRTPGVLGLREIALPFLQAVHARVRQHVQLAVRSELDVLVIDRISARDAVVNASIIGGRIPLQHSSAGLVLLAAADESVMLGVLQRGLDPITESSIRTEAELRGAVDSARREGYAISSSRIFRGSRGLAVPVRGAQGVTVGAIGIVEPDDDSSPMGRVHLLRRAAEGVSEALLRSYLPPDHPDALPGGSYRSLVSSSEQSMEYLESIARPAGHTSGTTDS